MAKKDNAAKVVERALSDRRIEYIPLSRVNGAKRNPKLHAVSDINASMGRFGFTEPIMMDERTGLLVAGHGRLETLAAMRQANKSAPEGISLAPDGEWMVPVVRGWASRSDEDAEAYILASNQLTTKGGWDNGALAEMLKDLAAAGALEGTGFGAKELADLLDEIDTPLPDDIDDAPEPPDEKDCYVQLGHRYQLGLHRIMCGSSTEPADVDALMRGDFADICWTDPPWNVAYGDNDHPTYKKHKAIANDDLGEDFPQFCALFCGEIKRVVKAGAPLYMAMSAQEWPVIHKALTDMGFHWSSTIIWAKDSLVLSRKDYHTQYEPIWYGWQAEAARLVALEDRTQSDLWQIPRPKKSDEHPTMKPVELVVRSLKNSSARGAIVYEPFSGSGSTLLACETTGRACRAMELEPAYVQVAIERWQKLTGQKAERIE